MSNAKMKDASNTLRNLRATLRNFTDAGQLDTSKHLRCVLHRVWSRSLLFYCETRSNWSTVGNYVKTDLEKKKRSLGTVTNDAIGRDCKTEKKRAQRPQTLLFSSIPEIIFGPELITCSARWFRAVASVDSAANSIFYARFRRKLPPWKLFEHGRSVAWSRMTWRVYSLVSIDEPQSNNLCFVPFSLRMANAI